MSAATLSIRQVKAARALLGWSQAELAKASGVSEPTIKRLEAGDGELGGRAGTMGAILYAFEAAGIVFLMPGVNGGGPGVQLRAAKRSLGSTIRLEDLNAANDV
jgi:transcriptional regulator with XRE-family HTH domain